jgi:uncharacterized membrane protein YhaH (DUF805 family)
MAEDEFEPRSENSVGEGISIDVITMSLLEGFIVSYKEMFKISGRARRKQYWGLCLYSSLIIIVIGIISLILVPVSQDMAMAVVILNGVYGIAFSIAQLTCGIRRLHDTGRSGWNYLWGFVPFVGWIFMVLWICCENSEGRENRYGPCPKGTW